MTAPNELTRDIHDRMPVILDPEDYDRWLDGPGGPELLRSYPSEKMARYPVSKDVGNVKNHGPELIAPID